MEKAYFAAGCFWGVEHAFKQLEGVVNTVVGYQGGSVENPTYKEVCDKKTGHAESVEVNFDPDIIGLERLLDAFFFMHNPTELNRQGPDVGPQYRSALFPINEDQEKFYRIYIQKLIDEKRYNAPIMTSIEPQSMFYSAEELHQDYLHNNPSGYCHIGLDVFAKLKQGLF